MQFYLMDWMRDLLEHPLEIEGAWVRIICKMWWSEPLRGILEKTPEQWCKIIGVSEDDVIRILTYIKDEKIGDVTNLSQNCHGDVTDCHKKITVINRRMYRESKAKENDRLRQQRQRDKSKRHGDNHTEVTTPSSSSSSSSPSKKLKESGKTKSFSAFFQDQFDSIIERCQTIKSLEKKKDKFNPFQWVQFHIKENAHPRAIMETLDGLIDHWDLIDSVWSYGNNIIDTKSQNYHEEDHITQSAEFKKDFTSKEMTSLMKKMFDKFGK